MPTGHVEPPASSTQTYTEGNLFHVSVPSNWREIPGNGAVTFAPDGGYGEANGQSTFTHGVEIGSARNETHDLQTSTDELVDSLARGNPSLRRQATPARIDVGGRPGLKTVLSNTSSIGQPESIVVFTTQLRDGNLFFAVAVAPQDVFSSYRGVFDRIVSSIELLD
jgi:hypothetical protein